MEWAFAKSGHVVDGSAGCGTHMAHSGMWDTYGPPLDVGHIWSTVSRSKDWDAPGCLSLYNTLYLVCSSVLLFCILPRCVLSICVLFICILPFCVLSRCVLSICVLPSVSCPSMSCAAVSRSSVSCPSMSYPFSICVLPKCV
jgi:hypothetical protein